MTARPDGTLLRAGHVLTAADPPVIRDGAVRILNGRIDAVGEYSELSTSHPDDVRVGTEHDIVAPGFVNVHGHFSEGLLAGTGEQFTLWEWIDRVVDPAASVLTPEMAEVGTLLAGIQMLRTGVTVANDMFVYDPTDEAPFVTLGVTRGIDRLGLRGVLSFGAGDRAPATSPERVIEEHTALAEAVDRLDRCHFRVGIRALGAQSPELFRRNIDFATGGGHGAHIHLQEIRDEVTAVRRAHGVTPIEHCARNGLFEAPTLAAHCVWIDENDVEVLADHEVSVAHNPVANMILASGVCPVGELAAAGVPVGLGVDGAASNDRQDFLEVMKAASLLQRIDRLQATAMDARTAFELATIGGARALGLADEIGSLEVGKSADLVVLDGGSPALAAVHDPFQSLVYVAGPREIRDVWIAGERAVVDGEPARVDVDEVVGRARDLACRLAEESDIATLTTPADRGAAI